jgi:hypothetical protein
MTVITKYRINYDDTEHEENSIEAMEAYIVEQNLSNINIQTITEDIPNFYSLRVIPLLHTNSKHFYPLKIKQIDVRKHLQDSVILKKFISNIVKGRPDEAIYCLKQVDENNITTWVKIARIRFEFILDPVTKLCISRKEIMGFYNTNDEIDPDYEYEISSEQYEALQPDGITPHLYDIQKMSTESEQTLKLIIINLKMKVNGALVSIYMPQGKTYAEVLDMGVALMDKHEKDIATYERTGKGNFRTSIENDTEFAWLNDLIAPNYTIRNLIMDEVE